MPAVPAVAAKALLCKYNYKLNKNKEPLHNAGVRCLYMAILLSEELEGEEEAALPSAAWAAAGEEWQVLLHIYH